MRYRPGEPDMYTEIEMRGRLIPVYARLLMDRIKGREGFDILLTHAPCKGYGDQEDLPHRGFDCFNTLLNRYRPKLQCYGHVHQEYGQFQRAREHPSGAALINASGHYIFELKSV
jgi:Icc-related predicted phosphoesterase